MAVFLAFLKKKMLSRCAMQIAGLVSIVSTKAHVAAICTFTLNLITDGD